MLFAACLEAIGLNPIIVVTEGHAFVGVWLDDQRFNGIINFDQAAISKRIAIGIKEIALIESTSLCKGSNLTFKDAMNSAETQMMDSSRFLLSLDIKNARSEGISPLPLLKNETINSIEFRYPIKIQQNLIRILIWERSTTIWNLPTSPI